jgi:hypothetical protein
MYIEKTKLMDKIYSQHEGLLGLILDGLVNGKTTEDQDYNT